MHQNAFTARKRVNLA